MSMSSEFKEFIMKGNVMDLAIGFIIGARRDEADCDRAERGARRPDR